MAYKLRPAALFGAMSVLFAVAPAAQDATSASVAGDRAAIEWLLPGDFDAALARAKAEQRIMVVKGISVIADVAGAKCATKGVW